MPRPELPCCVPYGVPMPSGWKWAHSRKCPEWPGQLVGRERTPERVAAVRARIEHPAGRNIGGNSAVQAWLDHPPRHGCAACQYVEHWLDRDDDEIGVDL